MMNPDNHIEIFPVVDEAGNEISTAPRTVCHDGKSMLLHPVIHLHLFNKKGELFLQKRAMNKDLLPGKWDTSVGGHFQPGESAEEALMRETEEELGIKSLSFNFIKKYIWESPRERELVYSFTCTSDCEPIIDNNEISDGRFWKIQEIEDNLNSDLFTPNFIYEFNTILKVTERQ